MLQFIKEVNEMLKILVVEDNPDISELLYTYLKNENYDVTIASDGEEAIHIYYDIVPDLILLDLMLPKINGYDVCKSIREDSDVPIIMLTALDEEKNQLKGFELKIDDYITKPFKLAVFLSRINALLRRSDNFNQADTEFNSNGIKVQLLKGEVYKNGEQLDLTSSEYKLLCLFIENPDIVLSAEQILSKLWDCNENYIDNNALTVYIRRLRTKIENNPSQPQKIVTVRRMGYKWNTTL